MSSLFLAIALAAWPVPPDAGAADYARPENWPREPGWSEAWPLFSFAPAEWTMLDARERDAGVGMGVDRAWSFTRGQPAVTIAVVGTGFDLADPVMARAWRLNDAEAPDAGDVNGNGRLDVDDFASDPRISDVNGNGALDLEDVLTGLADGVDQDGDGRADDLCGWDLDQRRPLSSTDAGRETLRAIAAPVDDARPGLGACPECTVLPIGARSVEAGLWAAIDAGARVVLLPHREDDVSAALLAALDAGVVVITPGSGNATTWPLALQPGVWSPRTLTTDQLHTTALLRTGCGGNALGTHSISTTGCVEEAAATLAGVAGLLRSVAPDATVHQLSGLLGGARTDVGRAVTSPASAAPSPVERGRPSLFIPTSAADSCAIDLGAGEEPVSCDGGVPLSAPSGVAWFIERAGSSEWWTPLLAPPLDARGELIGTTPLGPGSGPVRYLDLDGLDSDAALATTPFGLVGLTAKGLETLTPSLAAGRHPFAIGDVDGDRNLDLATLGDDGHLQVHDFTGRLVLDEQLAARPAGGPVISPSFDGPALITLDVDGQLTHRVGASRWQVQLPSPQRSAPAVGFIDRDARADLAIADGTTLHVLITNAQGPGSASWTAPTRATEALLANLVGDAALEIVAERVFDASGEVLLTLDGWTPPVTPSALVRLTRGAARSLVQLERRADGAVELTRYDVEVALRRGDSLVARRVLKVLPHPPARGGFCVADVTSDREPDVLIPTEDGLIFIVDGEGDSPFESPMPTWGTVASAPSLGVRDNQLEYAVRTTRGDVVRFLGRGLVEDIEWEGPGHDRANTRNAETALPPRRMSGLGITQPPKIPTGCGCAQVDVAGALALLFLFRRRRGSC